MSATAFSHPHRDQVQAMAPAELSAELTAGLASCSAVSRAATVVPPADLDLAPAELTGSKDSTASCGDGFSGRDGRVEGCDGVGFGG
jgi:hypothetical protein